MNHEFQNQIQILDPKKVPVKNDIPTRMLIETIDISWVFLTKIYNDSIEDQLFPGPLKDAVLPIHKKEERSKKENYCPVSLLPTISQLFMCTIK